MQNIELTEIQFNVLWSLAIDGTSSSKSELWKERKVGKKATVGRALCFLESLGLVKIGEPRGIRRKMSCDLTTAGLFALLASDSEDVWKNLDRIITKHRSKVPLIFDNWDSFIYKGIVDAVKYRVVEYFKLPQHFYLSSYNILRHRKTEEQTERLLEEDLTRHVLFPYILPYVYELYLPELADYLYFPISPVPRKEEVEGWIEAMFRYPDLKQYLLKELVRLENWCKKMSRSVEQWKSIVQKLEMAQKGEDKEKNG